MANINREDTNREDINRDDMLELTRRMTVNRNCFSRIAGAYFDEEGFIDGTFNRHFLKLSAGERAKNLEIAKEIPFSKTNENLVQYSYTKELRKPGTVGQLLVALRECELKNDALLETFYELLGEQYHSDGPYACYFFYGNYDVPLKGSDKSDMWESEEVYRFMVCAICPIHGDYEPGEPETGFLYPAFAERSTDMNAINVFHREAKGLHKELEEILGVQERL